MVMLVSVEWVQACMQMCGGECRHAYMHAYMCIVRGECRHAYMCIVRGECRHGYMCIVRGECRRAYMCIMCGEFRHAGRCILWIAGMQADVWRGVAVVWSDGMQAAELAPTMCLIGHSKAISHPSNNRPWVPGLKPTNLPLLEGPRQASISGEQGTLYALRSTLNRSTDNSKDPTPTGVCKSKSTERWW